MPTTCSKPIIARDLKALLDSLRDNTTAYVVRCAPVIPIPMGQVEIRSSTTSGFPVASRSALDLPRSRTDLAGLAAGRIAIRWSEVVVRHTGYVEKGIWKRKLQRNERILTEELAGTAQ